MIEPEDFFFLFSIFNIILENDLIKYWNVKHCHIIIYG